MTAISSSDQGVSPVQTSAVVYNRVPAVTADFWLIKLMAVTMGETAADYLAVNLGFGLTTTSLIMSAVLIGALVLQFAQKIRSVLQFRTRLVVVRMPKHLAR